MKKLALILTLVLALCVLSGCGGNKTETEGTQSADTQTATSASKLTVFNCYDYIDPDVLELFEQETGIEVEYCNYTTNEEMYTKLEAVTGTYDVIFPSDYMIERLIANDMIEELDMEKLPNAQGLMERFKNPDYDENNAHSIPYMWGTLGYLYNTEMIDEDLDSWSALFDSKYAGQVLMMSSMRDTVGIALKYLGYSLNTHDESELNAARDLLLKQKQDKIQAGYLLDETKDKMVGGEAAIGVIYSGDAQYAIEKNDKLKYVIPKEGSNIWVDGMCIPKGSRNVDAAHQFIDFMCREDIAKMNFDYIHYCTPIQAVADGMSEEEKALSTLNPSDEAIDKCEYFHDVSDCMSLYENVWTEVRMAR